MPTDTDNANGEAVPQELLDDLANTTRSLTFAALDSELSFEDAEAVFNRGREIRKRMISLDAKRFNTATQRFQAALGRLNKAIADVNLELQEIKNVERLLMKATQVFTAAGKLIGLAAKTAVDAAL